LGLPFPLLNRQSGVDINYWVAERMLLDAG